MHPVVVNQQAPKEVFWHAGRLFARLIDPMEGVKFVISEQEVYFFHLW